MSIFLDACRRKATPYTPVWLMRQAGRYQKRYRALREKVPFLELCKNAELAAEVTVSAQAALGADAAILFSDILLIIEPMGFALSYPKGDGPLIENPVRTTADVDRVKTFKPSVGATGRSPLPFVGETIRLARKNLKPDIALIGFAGAPFTLASYLIEGGASRDFAATRRFFREEPAAWKALLEKIAAATSDYLSFQIACGVDAVQLFDSWAGALSPDEYRAHAAPYTRKVFEALPPGVPAIHFGTKTGPFLEAFAEAGGSVIGVDHRVGLDEAWRRVGPDRAVQGNLDPEILRTADRKTLEYEVRRVLSLAAGRPGHIFNLGHGVLPETPEENAKMLVDMVHEFSRL